MSDDTNITDNKKDLLRERKRHTARKRAQDTDPPRWLTHPPPAGPDPPLSAHWPDPPPPAGPDPPHQLTDLTPPPPPSAHWPDPPQLDLTLPPPAGPDPPQGVDRQTKWNYYLPVVLRTRAVKIVLSVSLIHFLVVRIFFWHSVVP